MTSQSLRLLAGIASVAALTACSDSPSATVTDPTGATQSSKGTESTSANATIIQLVRPVAPVFARAEGKAKFETKSGERQLEIEVEDVPAGTALIFTLGNVRLGTATANSLGNARLDLNSKRNAGVPMSVVGLSVVVGTSGGRVVVSGTF